ncbi:MAG: CoA pyrophosphatase [Spirochaetaceae bacterium]|nr:CoA pyrophosphatase [Spirochaetaceae bacterium]
MNEILQKKIMDCIPSDPGVMNSSTYLKSAVLASLYIKEDQPHLIFQKRSSTIKQGGEICFPGGRFDRSKDRNMMETSVRETIEEMGVPREDILVFGQIDTLVATMGTVISCFIGELKIENLSQLTINRDEVEKVFSIPLRWFIENPPAEYNVHLEIKPHYTDEEGKKVVLLPVEELGLPDRYRKPWGLKKHKIYVYKKEGETIWGITAQIVKHISELLKDVL